VRRNFIIDFILIVLNAVLILCKLIFIHDVDDGFVDLATTPMVSFIYQRLWINFPGKNPAIPRNCICQHSIAELSGWIDEANHIAQIMRYC